MIELKDYLVPDYYPDFACKMGACRHACCEGWPVCISVDEYFRLLGAECSPRFRTLMDCALQVLRDPTPDRYAQIAPDLDGNCRLRAPDGRCALQLELGEEMLPDICRLYPRGIRAQGSFRCCCSNSCEATVEMFTGRREPLHFLYLPLSLAETEDEPDEPVKREMEARGLALIRLLQDRSRTLPQRLLDVCDALGAFSGEGEEPGLPETLDYSVGVMGRLSSRSETIREYGIQSARKYWDGGLTEANYLRAKEDFEQRFPEWETLFEHLLVNHMFFSLFPYVGGDVPLPETALGLCSVYMLLRMLCLGCVDGETTMDELVDLCADAFRFIDHTDWYEFASLVAWKGGKADRNRVKAQLQL